LGVHTIGEVFLFFVVSLSAACVGWVMLICCLAFAIHRVC